MRGRGRRRGREGGEESQVGRSGVDVIKLVMLLGFHGEMGVNEAR